MSTTIQAGCCIVGGGPAGMMLGFLLARAGVEVVVLEKHADFLRDYPIIAKDNLTKKRQSFDRPMTWALLVAQ